MSAPITTTVLTKRIDGWFPEQIGRHGPAGHHALREHDDPGGRGDSLRLNFLRGKVSAQRADRSIADGPKVSTYRLPARWRLPVAMVQDVGDEGQGSEAEKTQPLNRPRSNRSRPGTKRSRSRTRAEKESPRQSTAKQSREGPEAGGPRPGERRGPAQRIAGV